MNSRAGLLRDERGNVSVVAALALPLLVGAGGFMVDSGYWYHQRAQLQASADAAASAAATELRRGSTASQVTAAAREAAARNGFDLVSGSMVVNTPPGSGPHQGETAVEVLLNEPMPRFFSRMLTDQPVTGRARAVALYQTAANACVLALDPSASGAIQVSGSGQLGLSGCDVMANSVASDAVSLKGSGQLSAPCVVSVGGVETTSNLTLTSCAAPVTHAPPVGDPFAKVAEPATPVSCNASNGSLLQPGRYCGGLSLRGSVTLQPGVYVITDGTLKVNANAVVSGSGVTIYLKGSSNVSMNGNATVNLTAPTTGDYAGILFFGDRTATASSSFNGTAQSSLVGALYLPKQNVSYLGDFTAPDGCTQVIADTIDWSGNATVKMDCSSHGMRSLPAVQPVRMVE
jgi:Flp pilus assembly protein TadG